jgi:F-box protein 18 (helicase)
VAITRTKNKVYFPETILPKDFPASPYIHVVKSKKDSDTKDNYSRDYKTSFSKPTPGGKKPSSRQLAEKTYSVSQKRESHKDAYQPWTSELDKELKKMYDSGMSVSKMALHLGRTKGAILSRLKRLDYFSG